MYPRFAFTVQIGTKIFKGVKVLGDTLHKLSEAGIRLGACSISVGGCEKGKK